MSEMKLIMESWKHYVEKAEVGDNGAVFLFEGSTPTKTDFNLLLERCNNKELTGDQLVNVWQESVEYEYQQLLTEIDWEKEAERTADPDYKPPQERSGGALEKINDFIFEKSVQAYELAKRGPAAASKAASMLYSLGERVGGKHPVLKKIIIIIGLAVTTYGLLSLFASTASAGIGRPGLEHLGVELTPELREQFEGALSWYERFKTMGFGDAMGPLNPSDPIVQAADHGRELVQKALEGKDTVGLDSFEGPAGEVLKTIHGALEKHLSLAGRANAFPGSKALLSKWEMLGNQILHAKP